MKKLAVAATVMVLSLSLYSQDYRNICTKGVTLYRDTAGNLQGFRYDSLQVTPDHDSVFTSFPTLLYNHATGIADSAGGSILGRKIIKKHDGWFLFFNKDGDTIFLNTRPKQNVLWKFVNLPNNGYIGAKITSLTYDSIMGLQDSVKVIMFQAYDSQSNPVLHPFNFKILKLSKHYGLCSVYNFWTFPGLSSSFEICGKTVPKIGFQPLRAIDIFNYDIGDEFHYHEVYQNFDYHGNHSDYKYMEKVVSKSMAEDSSGVTYIFSICYSGWYSLFPTGGGTTSGSFDKTVTYNFKALEKKYFLDRLPDEYFCYLTGEDGSGYANRYSGRIMSYNTQPRFQKRINEMVYVRNSSTGNNWMLLPKGFPDVPNLYMDYWDAFAAGLGLTHKNQHGMYGSVSDSVLVYFKKANETSGKPIAPDCKTLSGNKPDSTNETSIEVHPNPVITETTINLNGYDPRDGLQYFLYDYSGKKVLEAEIFSTSFIFDRTGLGNGLYIFIICDRNGNMKGKIKIAII